jgi:hypothetical protein
MGHVVRSVNAAGGWACCMIDGSNPDTYYVMEQD